MRKEKLALGILITAFVVLSTVPLGSEGPEPTGKIGSTLGFLLAYQPIYMKPPMETELSKIMDEIESTALIDVALLFDHELTQSEIRSLEEEIGMAFPRMDGKVLHIGQIYGASVPVDKVYDLAKKPSVVKIESTWKPGVRQTLDVSIPEINADDVWSLKDQFGNVVTGQGVRVADFDSGIDVMHPDFFRADGPTYNWIDNGNGVFDPGVDYVDLNSNNGPEPGETLDFIDATSEDGVFGTNNGIFEADMDFLYNDANNNGTRDYGTANGFTEANPTYGELLFCVNDTNNNNTLDVGETLQALGTSKVAAVLHAGVTYTRGADLINTPPDTGGHGTGVSSIILGGQRGYKRYVGVAPGAELLMANIGDEFTVYIPWAEALGADVMLYEFGGWVYAHLDGTSLLEMAIDNAAAKGIVQVVPAGNLANGCRHTDTPIPRGGNIPASFNVPAGFDTIYISVIWRTPANGLSFQLSGPGVGPIALPAGVPGAGWVGMGDFAGNYVMYERAVDSTKGTALYNIQISNPGNVTAGLWTLTIFDGWGHGEPVVDLYISNEGGGWGGCGGSGAEWIAPPQTNAKTTIWPATADSAITVASYSTRGRWVPIGDISSFSGRGPRTDGALVIDIAAPGNHDIGASKSKDSKDGTFGMYLWFGGTSAAGPHVAGCAALILQANPNFTHTTVKWTIQKTARTDAFTGATPNDTWGYGKLDCLASVKKALPKHEKKVPLQAIPTYWVNFDVVNTTGMWANDYHIVVKETEIVEWYTGNSNPWGEGRVVGEVATTLMLGMIIEWKGETEVLPGEMIHLGYRAQGSWNLEKPTRYVYPAWWTQNGNRVGDYTPYPGIRYEDKGWHITVYVKNDTGFPQVEFSNLQYTIRSGPVNINDLYWDNPSLIWEPLGEPQTIHLDQEVAVGALEASGEKYVIVRMICTESDNPENYVRVLFQRRADPPKSESENTVIYQVMLVATISLALFSGLLAAIRKKSKNG